MFEKLIHKDQELLVYLNNLGNEQWDAFWLAITNQLNWIPLFVVILGLIFWKFGWKKGLLITVFVALLITFSDQSTNFVKNFFERLRPNNDPIIGQKIRHLLNPQSFSFYSGHAAGSTIFSTFIILLLKDKIKYIWLIITFPILFAYSRLYLGVHYPTDIFMGVLAGVFFGTLFYRLYLLIEKKIFK